MNGAKTSKEEANKEEKVKKNQIVYIDFLFMVTSLKLIEIYSLYT